MSATGSQAFSPGAEQSLFLVPNGRKPRSLAWIVGALAIGVVVLALFYSPGPPSYTATTDALVIQDRFYPVTINADSVDVRHIRVVDIANDPGWRPAERTDSFSNSQYHAGWFRVGNGERARMYWASAQRLVLLPPRGNAAPVLLEAREPEEFAKELRRSWGEPL